MLFSFDILCPTRFYEPLHVLRDYVAFGTLPCTFSLPFRRTDLSCCTLQLAASSSSSSSSESESVVSDGGMAAFGRKARALPQLPGLARLASHPVASAAATQSTAARGLAAATASATSPAQPAAQRGTDAPSAPSPAAMHPELAAVLRLSGRSGAESPGEAAAAGRSASSAATSAATSSAAGSESEQMSAAAAQDRSAPRNNIVAAPPVPVVRVEVCQAKSCAKRGAADLLRQASAAGAGQPGVQVSGCKCLGKCKKAPAVRVRAGHERPTVLTQVCAA